MHIAARANGKRCFLVVAGLIALAGPPTASPAASAPAIIQQQQKVSPSTLHTNDYFGWSSGISGTNAVVGAFANGTDFHGSATFYHNDGTTWQQFPRITTPSGFSTDAFAQSVAIDGNVAVIGAAFDKQHGGGAGAAYVYQFDGTAWTLAQKIFGADTAGGDQFGTDVSISGNRIIVSAPDHASSAGAAYVFQRSGNTWGQIGELSAAGGANGFGRAVAVNGDWALVGATGSPSTAGGQAFAYHYTGTQWIQTQTLAPANEPASDDFATDVALASNGINNVPTAVIGAQSLVAAPFSSGAAFVFSLAGLNWQQQQLLAPSGSSDPTFFGRSVAIDGNQIVVGGYDSFNSPNIGAALTYTFDGTTWNPSLDLRPSDAAANNTFGISTSISGNVALVGALGDGTHGTNSGAAYFFNTPEPTTVSSLLAAAWLIGCRPSRRCGKRRGGSFPAGLGQK